MHRGDSQIRGIPINNICVSLEEGSYLDDPIERLESLEEAHHAHLRNTL
jgi:hypothetical protein